MPFVPVPNGLEIVIDQQIGDANVFNVLHATYGEGTLPEDPTEVANRVFEAWRLRIMPQVSSLVQLQVVRVRNINSEFAQAGESTNPAANGSKPIDMQPAQVAALIQKRTALRGRAFRGRLYLAGISSASTDPGPGNLLTVFRTALQGAVDQFRADVALASAPTPLTLVVVSRYQGVDANGRPIPRALGLATPITSMPVAFALATQRDRNRR
jgi:hypothetical protein